MHTKIAFLFFLVLFGAYAEHQAGKTLKRLNVRDGKITPTDTTSDGRDSTYIKKRLEISSLQTPHSKDNTSLSSMTGIRSQFYCMSARENTSFRPDWIQERAYNEFWKTFYERAVPKNSILPGAFEKSAMRYRQA